MRIITLAGMTVILFMLFLNPSISQNQQQRQKLNELSLKFERDFAIRKAEAIRLADSLNIPVRIESDGQTAELMFFENGMPVYNTTFNADGATLINSDDVHPGGSAGLSLTGSGQILGIWDGGKVLNTHQEFGGRVTQVDGATSLSNHATHVAGTMIATGLDPLARGMSYGANLYAYDWNSDASEMAAAAAGGLKVSQHSYGLVTGWAYGSWSGNENWHWFGIPSVSSTEDYGFGFYGWIAQDWDQIAYNAPNYLIVKSAGNDRGQGPVPGTGHYVWDDEWVWSTATRNLDGGINGYDCIPWNGVSKNILTVGAVDGLRNMSSFSSWGPTDDGRVKPDVVAKGVFVYSSVGPNNSDYSYYSGTSMSGPMVSGSTGLLLQHQQNLNPGEDLLSSTVKGLIIHSADDNISGAPGPDYRFGWGLMDTEKAADIMSQNKLADDIYIHELTLNNGNQITIPVKATGDEPLRATLVWNDVPGTPPPASLNPATLMLVNDLDLRILDAGSNTTFPYILNPANPSAAATTGDNFRDNVEMVHIQSPLGGQTYSIKISHKGTLNGGSQQFSLIITGIETVPVNLTLSGVTIPSGMHCFNATQTITTGGGGQQFDVASGSEVDLIAGQNIIMLPGTHFHSGSAVHALISPGGPYCPVLASSLLTEDLNEAEIQENLIASGKENFFRVFPNPATEGFTIELQAYDDQEVATIEIYSMMGKQMLIRELPAGPQHYVGLEEFNPGIYLVRVMQGKQTGIKKIIRQ